MEKNTVFIYNRHATTTNHWQQQRNSFNTSVCVHFFLCVSDYQLISKADNTNNNLRISGFLCITSSNCLCGMQDMKNTEEKSTLSDLYQTVRTRFSNTLFPLLLFQMGIFASDLRVSVYKPCFFSLVKAVFVFAEKIQSPPCRQVFIFFIFLFFIYYRPEEKLISFLFQEIHLGEKLELVFLIYFRHNLRFETH